LSAFIIPFEACLSKEVGIRGWITIFGQNNIIFFQRGKQKKVDSKPLEKSLRESTQIFLA